MLKKPRSLLWSFSAAILVATILFFFLPIAAKESWCASRDKQESIRADESTHGDQNAFNYAGGVPLGLKQQQSSARRTSDTSSSYAEFFRQSGFCEETRPTDIGIMYFTCCLVIVGWFGITASERASRNLERAYIFAGPHDPVWNGQSTATAISLENHGRSPGILKEAYGEYSATEPTGNPTYQNGTARKFDSAIPPAGPRPFNARVESIPTRWESPIQGDHYFFGYVRYIDIFRVEHECRFCSKIFPATRKTDIAGPEAWNDWN
jgi:hypothetical protein